MSLLTESSLAMSQLESQLRLDSFGLQYFRKRMRERSAEFTVSHKIKSVSDTPYVRFVILIRLLSSLLSLLSLHFVGWVQRISIVTWNMNGRLPKEPLYQLFVPDSKTIADIYAIG